MQCHPLPQKRRFYLGDLISYSKNIGESVRNHKLDIKRWPHPLLFPDEGVLACTGAVTDLASWQLVGIMASFYAAPHSSLISSYPASSMGWKFTGSGCLFPPMQDFLSYKIIFMSSQTILWMREKGLSVCNICGGMGVFRLWSETELMTVPIGTEDLTRTLRWSISLIYISIVSMSLEEQSRDTASYPPNTFW